MKAAYIERVGPPDEIIYGELPRPEPAGHQVLIRTGAVALNPVDTYIRGGLVPMDLPLPFIVGCDVVELSPPYDPSGASALLAAKVTRELLLLMASQENGGNGGRGE